MAPTLSSRFHPKTAQFAETVTTRGLCAGIPEAAFEYLAIFRTRELHHQCRACSAGS